MQLAQFTRGDSAFSSFRIAFLWNSLSFTHTGSAWRKEVKPRGAKAR